MPEFAIFRLNCLCPLIVIDCVVNSSLNIQKFDTPMQKTYKFTDLFGELLKKHPVLIQANRIESAFDSIGHNVNLVDMLRPTENSQPAKGGLFLTPNLSDSLEETLDNID